jgi:hypothetical protein
MEGYADSSAGLAVLLQEAVTPLSHILRSQQGTLQTHGHRHTVREWSSNRMRRATKGPFIPTTSPERVGVIVCFQGHPVRATA